MARWKVHTTAAAGCLQQQRNIIFPVYFTPGTLSPKQYTDCSCPWSSQLPWRQMPGPLPHHLSSEETCAATMATVKWHHRKQPKSEKKMSALPPNVIV